ncbi:MAG: efflux RND transporter periplasmic adaptor subunit [Peptococcaceae bacterium]
MPGNKQSRFIMLVVIVLGTFLSLVVSGGCSKKPAAETSAEAKLTEVNTVLVKKSFLDNQFVFPGIVAALQSADIVAKVPGKVAAVQVDLGSKVSAGQVLVTLENKDLADRVQQAQAGIEQAQAAGKLAQAALQAAEAGLATAQANFEVAEANYERGQELLAAGAIPEAVFQAEYELRYKQAKEQVEKALPAQLKIAQAQADQARAGLKSAQASLSLARTAYEDSFIRAPFSGVVAARNINPGEIASLAVPVISLINLNKVVVKVNVGEELINKLAVGKKVPVKVKAVSAKPFTGTVVNIAASADPQVKTYPVKLHLDNPAHLIKPGMFAEVNLDLEQSKSLLLPIEAVVKDQQDRYIVWVVKNGVVKSRLVKTGDSDAKQVVIQSGLAENEEVVIAGAEGLKVGQKVIAKRQ